MKNFLLPLILGAGLLSASGCAGVYSFNARPYHRPDTTADVRGEDYRACSWAASEAATTPKMDAGERTGRIALALVCLPCTIAAQDGSVQEKRERYLSECMAAKGYTVGLRSAQP